MVDSKKHLGWVHTKGCVDLVMVKVMLPLAHGVNHLQSEHILTFQAIIVLNLWIPSFSFPHSHVSSYNSFKLVDSFLLISDVHLLPPFLSTIYPQKTPPSNRTLAPVCRVHTSKRPWPKVALP